MVYINYYLTAFCFKMYYYYYFINDLGSKYDNEITRYDK